MISSVLHGVILANQLEDERPHSAEKHAARRSDDSALGDDVEARAGRLGDSAAAVVEQVERALRGHARTVREHREVVGGLGERHLALVLLGQELRASLVDLGGRLVEFVSQNQERWGRRIERHAVG